MKSRTDSTRLVHFPANTKMNTHTISFNRDGTAWCLWTEAVPLHQLGRLEIQRASTVEFNSATQEWGVRLASNPDAVVFSHPSRETCQLGRENTQCFALPLFAEIENVGLVGSIPFTRSKS